MTTKEKITSLLKGTRKKGMTRLITALDGMGFWTAPASTSASKHSAYDGGLAEHSLSVYRTAERIAKAVLTKEERTPEFMRSLKVVCLLHDLGKCGDYGKSLYVPNVLKSGKRSESKPWARNGSLSNIPHAFRGALMIERFITLTEEEEYAIMYHDGLYDRETGGMAIIPGHETKLLLILHMADLWSSRFQEDGEV